MAKRILILSHQLLIGLCL